MKDNGNNSDGNPPAPPFAGGNEVEPEIIPGGPGSTDADSSDAGGESGSQTREVNRVDVDELDQAWAPYFRYDAVYQDQIEAIDNFVEILAQSGYYVLEGACGTGKTLAAVTGGIHAIRDRDHLTQAMDTDGEFPNYERMLVVTPLKQQLRQFVAEMKGINESAPLGVDPVSTVVIRGKSDMMPYAYVDIQPFDRHSIYEKADDLREMTREIVQFDSSIPLDWPDGSSPPAYSKYDYDWENASEQAIAMKERYRYDPARAEALTEIVANLTHSGGEEYDRLTVNGVETPYPDMVPHTNDIVDVGVLQRRGTGQLPVDLQGNFDPFYAGALACVSELPFGFETADQHVFDRETLFREAASQGICPHESMGMLASKSEVVLGNYYHLFDPETRLLTDDKLGLLDDETIVAADEGHQIEERVRDMLSDSLDIYTLNKAVNDVEIALNYGRGDIEETPTKSMSDDEARKARQLLNKTRKTVPPLEVSLDEIEEVAEFFRFAKQRLTEYGADGISERYSDYTWQEALDYWGGDPVENALSDPDHPGRMDTFLEEALAQDEFSSKTFTNAYNVMLAMKFFYDELADAGIHDRTPQGVEVGRFFRRWATEDSVEYHREAVLDVRPKDSVPTEFPDWVKGWTPKFQLFNCIPRDSLREVFGELGGGVLMSATLQPEDIFTEAIGIKGVPYPSEEEDEADGEEGEPAAPEGVSASAEVGYDPGVDTSDVPTPEPPSAGAVDETRPTAFDSFPLRFPAENRTSIIADLPKYTNRNRKKPVGERSKMSRTRKQYADFLEEMVGQRGNILIAMPSYREAEWAHDYLKERGVNKRFHLDQSSSALETDETLAEFFAEGDAVIFTSSRSTITEGVDYDGDKLHGCVAVGIPLLPTNSKRIDAVIEAYDKRIEGAKGFETALTIPAVRKVRQAFGRVIRGSDEAGFRVLADKRYALTDWSGVNGYLSEQERAEFNRMDPDNVSQALQIFWDDVDERRPLGDQEEADQGEGATDESGEGNETAGDDAAQTSDEEGISDVWGERESDDSKQKSESEESTTSTDSTKEGSTSTGGIGTSYEKIYFGDGANLSSWTPIEFDVIEEEIVPLVEANTVDEDDEETDYIYLNFSKAISVSDWTKVKADVVLNEIEPIARRAGMF